MDLSVDEIVSALPRIRNLRIATPATVTHSVVIPFATYSPWFDDSEFVDCYNAVRQNTLVDLYRLHELWTLAGQLANRGGDFLEVGVWRGGTGCLMAARAKALGSPARIFLCDTFSGVVKAGGMDAHYKGGEHADTSVEIVRDLAAKMGLDNIDLLKGVFPDETGQRVADRTIALCHIDVDVYESAGQVLDWVWPRLQVGGVVVFDDYGFSTCDGVTRLVNERARDADALTMHNLNGHGVMVKLAG